MQSRRNKLHLVAKGKNNGIDERYVIDLDTREIFKLQFDEISAETVDFSSRYTYGVLRANLFSNIRQWMFN
jgi:hypothetical protein